MSVAKAGETQPKEKDLGAAPAALKRKHATNDEVCGMDRCRDVLSLSCRLRKHHPRKLASTPVATL
jgi:hypothetical protein